MSQGEHLIGEAVWIELTEVARCYRISTTEITAWIDAGLVTQARQHRGFLVLASVELETVATLVRLTRVVGLDAQTIATLREAGDLPGLGT